MLEVLRKGLIDFFDQGGFVMMPLVALSVILFTAVFRLALELYDGRKMKHPALAKSDGSNAIDVEELAAERTAWQLHFDRRYRFARIVSATAPLVGLLGTVAGMLKTFKGMGSGANAMDLIAKGISEALITTETGLSIAIAGFIFLWAIQGLSLIHI